MSSVFFYEPFYEFERILNDALSGRQTPDNGQQGQQGQQEQQLQHQQRRSTNLVRSFKPRMDLHEDAEKNLVTATFEFPGVSKEGISIEVHNGRLTVSAETKESTKKNENGYAIRERAYGKFSRTLQLPRDVKVSLSDFEVVKILTIF